jgi:hypothetical protein
VAKVSDSYRARFVEMRNGAEVEIYTQRAKDDGTEINPPSIPPQAPEHMYFVGWGESATSEEPVETFGTLSETTPEVTFYAIYKDIEYQIEFVDSNEYGDTYHQTTTATCKQTIELPSLIPGRIMEEEISFGIDPTTLPERDVKIEEKNYNFFIPEAQRIEFVGWTSNPTKAGLAPSRDEALNRVDENITDIKPTSNKIYYAVFAQVSALDKPESLYGFNFTEVSGGYEISIQEGVSFKGRITIPAKYNDKNVVSISGFNDLKDVFHIFFEKGSVLEEVKARCFKASTTIGLTRRNSLKGVYLPNTVKKIGAEAFMN